MNSAFQKCTDSKNVFTNNLHNNNKEVNLSRVEFNLSHRDILQPEMPVLYCERLSDDERASCHHLHRCYSYMNRLVYKMVHFDLFSFFFRLSCSRSGWGCLFMRSCFFCCSSVERLPSFTSAVDSGVRELGT